MTLSSIYFSATGTTHTISSAIALNISADVVEHDVTNHPLTDDIKFTSDDVILVAMPVYAGRIPAIAVPSLRHLRGSGTPAVIVAVYGNRHYDDALVEMQDILEQQGFYIQAAGAFIAQHSIFPSTAHGRPDNSDFQRINEFSMLCRRFLEDGTHHGHISLPGHRPYKVPGSIPLVVKGNRRCTECGRCVSLCPVGAISADNPRITDTSLCIHCGRCISMCPRHARHFSGIKYLIASYRFNKRNHVRREPETFFPGE